MASHPESAATSGMQAALRVALVSVRRQRAALSRQRALISEGGHSSWPLETKLQRLRGGVPQDGRCRSCCVRLWCWGGVPASGVPWAIVSADDLTYACSSLIADAARPARRGVASGCRGCTEAASDAQLGEAKTAKAAKSSKGSRTVLWPLRRSRSVWILRVHLRRRPPLPATRRSS